MTMAFDLLIIGDDEAALCAAAAAARAGAPTALLRRKKAKRARKASFCDLPNFVWRRLDLHEYGVAIEPVSARVTLFEEGKSVATHPAARESKDSLIADNAGDRLVWPDFVEEMKQLGKRSRLKDAAAGANAKNGSALSYLLDDDLLYSVLRQTTASCVDLLEDYFVDPQVKAHVAAHALSTAGLGGEEAGAALVLPEFFDDDAWRVRPTKDSPPLLQTLAAVCRDSGVAIYEDDIGEMAPEGAKHQAVTLAGGEKLKVRYVLFATPQSAAAAGMRADLSPLAAPGGAVAQLRVKLKEPVSAPMGDEHAVYQIVDGLDDLRSARAAAVDGRLPEKLPVEFEFSDNGDIIARTAYCPRAFREDDGARGWTGQDRQVVTKRIMEQLASRLDGLAAKVRKTDIEIIGADAPERPLRLNGAGNIFIQPSRHNAVSEAVKLVDKVLRGE